MLRPVRVLWLVPRFGERIAELMEAPLMLAVIILAARWVTRRFVMSPLHLLAVGFIALGLMLTAKFAVVLGPRGLTIPEYFASRDPVSGTVYVVMLGLFTVMPLIVRRR